MIKNGFKDIMQGRILSGELKPGDKLPPERELAAELGISRGSVNQGILDLERMGFLRVVPRRGTFVADYLDNGTPQTLTAIMNYDSDRIDAPLFRDLADMRILVERESVRLACERITPEDMDRLHEFTSKIYSSEGEELISALYSYHRNLVRIGRNVGYLLVFQSFEFMIINAIRVHYSNADEKRKCLPAYSQLTVALSNRNATAADRLILEILGTACDYVNSILEAKKSDT
ncbi:MAG: GntR family transcriptional regulator [Bacillota bacterium]|nr:GntR family transcriptional regulator [Bacillota bacterium]